MQPSPAPNVTELLIAWSGGDADALEKLAPLVYEQLHRSARHYIAGERPGHQLQATALVNEAYLRLVESQRMDWQNRAHFFAVSAQLMRRILVDFARSSKSEKHGGNLKQTALDDALVVGGPPDSDLVALDDALTDLAAMDSKDLSRSLLRSSVMRTFAGVRIGKPPRKYAVKFMHTGFACQDKSEDRKTSLLQGCSLENDFDVPHHAPCA